MLCFTLSISSLAFSRWVSQSKPSMMSPSVPSMAILSPLVAVVNLPAAAVLTTFPSLTTFRRRCLPISRTCAEPYNVSAAGSESPSMRDIPATGFVCTHASTRALTVVTASLMSVLSMHLRHEPVVSVSGFVVLLSTSERYTALAV